jgi:putative intracellular protease/amidase
MKKTHLFTIHFIGTPCASIVPTSLQVFRLGSFPFKGTNFMKHFFSMISACLILSCTSPNKASQVKVLNSAQSSNKKILVIVSAADTFELAKGFKIESGYFISELGPTLRKLSAEGYSIDFATPGGKQPTIDTHGLDLNFYMIGGLTNASTAAAERDRDLKSAEQHFGRVKFSTNKVAPELENLLSDFKSKQINNKVTELPLLTLEEMTAESKLNSYAGLYIPGGHAPKEDLVYSAALGTILRHFHENKKPTAIICHAPITLLSTMNGWNFDVKVTDQMKANFPYLGYKITLGSAQEEWLLENLLYLRGQKLKYYVEKEAMEAGLIVNNNRIPSTKQVVVDRELLTGANPASTAELADKFYAALQGQ